VGRADFGFGLSGFWRFSARNRPRVSATSHAVVVASTGETSPSHLDSNGIAGCGSTVIIQNSRHKTCVLGRSAFASDTGLYALCLYPP
jgi:hypothetical protein